MPRQLEVQPLYAVVERGFQAGGSDMGKLLLCATVLTGTAAAGTISRAVFPRGHHCRFPTYHTVRKSHLSDGTLSPVTRGFGGDAGQRPEMHRVANRSGADRRETASTRPIIQRLNRNRAL